LIPKEFSSFIHQAFFSGYSLLVAIRTDFTTYHLKHSVCRNSYTILLVECEIGTSNWLSIFLGH
jgi:hypothetical protein